MAKSRPESRTPRSSHTRDVFTPSPREPARLPQGACHFKDVSAAESRARCGCRRFWTNGLVHETIDASGSPSSRSPLRPWCMCGHHACFHDVEPGRTTTTTTSSTQQTPEQLNRVTAAPPSPRPVVVHRAECASCQGQHARTLQAGHVEAGTPLNPSDLWRADSEDRRAPLAPGMPRNPYGAQVDAPGLPPIPSQCLMDSDDGALSIRTFFIGDQWDEGGREETGSGNRGVELEAFPNHGPKASPRAPNSSSGSRPRVIHSYSTGSPRNPAGKATVRGLLGTGNTTPIRTHLGRHVATIRSADGSVSGRPGTAPIGYSPLRDASLDEGQCPTQLATPIQGGTPEMATGPKFEASLTQLTDIIRDLQHRDENRTPREGSGALSDARSPFSNGKEDQADPMAVARALQRLVPCLDTLTAQMAAYPSMVTALQRHAKRLESLENASVSHSPHEDWSDRVDLVDGRVTEIEGKVDDLERWKVSLDEDVHSANGPDVQRTRKLVEEAHASASFVSNVSARSKISAVSSSSALMAAVMDQAELASRLTSVEARLSTVELSAPPSVERPWSVEVVILPWGRDLRGIWTLTDATTHAESDASEWIQTREVSRTNSFNQGETGDAVWTGLSIQRWAEDTDHWKSARACNTRSRVYKRLRSRGLVREVEVVGGSASDVQAAVMDACGEVLRLLNDDHEHHQHSRTQGASEMEDGSPALGLQAPFIPLRKVHKDSRLRFLSPAEMVTSALWTVEFLSSSVVMKAVQGQRRLFVTHRDGYLQQQDHDSPAGWTWQRLRELPKVDRSSESLEVLEGDALETCWEWDPRLDPPQSSSSSVVVDACQSSLFPLENQSNGLKSTVEHSEAAVPDRSQSSSSASRRRGSVSPESRRRGLPASPISTLPATDLKRPRPTAAPLPTPGTIGTHGDASMSQRKRVDCLTIKPKSKRRRISRSPTAEWLSGPGGINCAPTPRRSRPNSPFFEGIIMDDGRSQATTCCRLSNPVVKRGETPLAYATPHSGPAMTIMESRLKKEDESHGPGEGPDHVGEEDAWEGVGGDEDPEDGSHMVVDVELGIDDGSDDDGDDDDDHEDEDQDEDQDQDQDEEESSEEDPMDEEEEVEVEVEMEEDEDED
ncbi:MAG: ERMES complex Ca(2+)-binding regulatory GTPase gem1 [Watsoniomyces obsoletus]|nr:MAG: ERMES complex Ca(2+)-binding regulatory GTPase gem1 [Watsoniomyces obsoletus]